MLITREEFRANQKLSFRSSEWSDEWNEVSIDPVYIDVLCKHANIAK